MPELPPQGISPVWIASYPRSGNTFLRILLQNIFGLVSYSLYRIEGDTHPDPSADALEESPYLPANWRKRISNDATAALTLIKTHDPPDDEHRAIYLIRDGRPAIHSYYHYTLKYAFEKLSLTEVIAGACQFGSWSEHYVNWKPKTRPKTLFLRYEDLVANPTDIIPKLAEFLKAPPVGGTLPTFEELQRKQPSFFRRGKNTDFATEWTPGQLALFNELHGPVTQELGYPLASATESAAQMTKVLAQTGARLYKERLDHLTQLGGAAQVGKQLASQLEESVKQAVSLRAEMAELSQQLELRSQQLADYRRSYSRLMDRSWVKIGVALRVLRRSADGTLK
jgi:hypothetical protein